MKAAKSVADEGVPSDLDIGNVDSPTPEMHESLDVALDAAGIGFEGEEPTPSAIETPEASAEEPVIEEPAKEPAVEDDPAVEKPKDEPKTDKPLVVEETPEEKEQKRVEELSAIDLDKVEPPAGISPRNLVNFDRLRDVAKLHKSRVDELERTVQELKTTAPQSVLAEEEKKELEELRNFRKIFDTENDPEFKRQFDERVSSVDEDVLTILKSNGLPEKVEQDIRAIGLGNVSPKFWEQQILPRLSFVERERVQRRLAERADISDQRKREIEKFTSQRDQVLQEREERQFKQFEEERGAIMHHVEELTKDIPWARRVEIPEKAAKEERAKMEAHNKSVEELEVRFNEALFPPTPQARAEIAAAAVASIRLAGSVKDLSTRLAAADTRAKQLEAELSKIKSAGRVPGGQRMARRPSDSVDPNETMKMSNDDAIEQGLQAAESSLS